MKRFFPTFLVSLLVLVIGVCLAACTTQHFHTFSEEWTFDERAHWHAATCEHTGEISKYALHTFGDWTTTKNPTDMEYGERSRECLICHYGQKETIEKLDHTHTFSSEWFYDDTYHWHPSSCGHEEIITGKQAHVWNDGVVTKAATETETGLIVYTCRICSCTKTEILSKEPHTHRFSAEWSYNEYSHWHEAVCEHTELVADKKAHDFGEPVITKTATVDHEGSMYQECVVCGYRESSVIPIIPSYRIEYWGYRWNESLHKDEYGVIASNKVASNTQAAAPTLPICHDYTFVRWDREGVIADKDLRVNAVYRPITTGDNCFYFEHLFDTEGRLHVTVRVTGNVSFALCQGAIAWQGDEVVYLSGTKIIDRGMLELNVQQEDNRIRFAYINPTDIEEEESLWEFVFDTEDVGYVKFTLTVDDVADDVYVTQGYQDVQEYSVRWGIVE